MSEGKTKEGADNILIWLDVRDDLLRSASPHFITMLYCCHDILRPRYPVGSTLFKMLG